MIRNWQKLPLPEDLDLLYAPQPKLRHHQLKPPVPPVPPVINLTYQVLVGLLVPDEPIIQLLSTVPELCIYIIILCIDCTILYCTYIPVYTQLQTITNPDNPSVYHPYSLPHHTPYLPPLPPPSNPTSPQPFLSFNQHARSFPYRKKYQKQKHSFCSINSIIK